MNDAHIVVTLIDKYSSLGVSDSIMSFSLGKLIRNEMLKAHTEAKRRGALSATVTLSRRSKKERFPRVEIEYADKEN